jgi:hypothetical protein
VALPWEPASEQEPVQPCVQASAQEEEQEGCEICDVRLLVENGVNDAQNNHWLLPLYRHPSHIPEHPVSQYWIQVTPREDKEEHTMICA